MKIRRLVCGAAALAVLAGAAVAAPAPDARPDPSPTPKARPGTARRYAEPFRTDSFTFPLSKSGEEGSEVEYYIRMKAGAALVYSWRVEGLPRGGDFYADFHGTTSRTGPGRAVIYREGGETTANGSLTAPFAGSHGWLFKNDSPEPVKVRLTIAGFYDLPSIRETMGIGGTSEFVPFGPPNWPHRYGPPKGR